MNKHNKITDDVFYNAVMKLAKDNIENTLSLPGIYEIISEHYNNDALDLSLEEINGKRRKHLNEFIQKQKVFHTPLYMRK